MKYKEMKTSGRTFLLRLEKGDDILGALKDFVKNNKIKGGFFTGIGAVSKASIQYFNAEKKEYETKVYEEDLEVTALVGNIAWKDGDPIIHTHITLGRKDNSALAGHCGTPTTVSVTMEIFIVETDTEINRAPDPEWNLVLLDLK